MIKKLKETPQKKGARTRVKNLRRNGLLNHVEGFISGYLLAQFDSQNGIKRHPKMLAKIAAAGYKSGL